MNDAPEVDIQELIKSLVAQELSKAKAEQSRGNPVVEASQRGKPVVEPARYLKHYRCDLSPDVTIVARAIEGGKLGSVLKGKSIKFRRGHFFATTQEEMDQIEWMMTNPAFDPGDTDKVLGGMPSIYEADGKELTSCPYCDEMFVAGSNALKSHLRATHGAS